MITCSPQRYLANNRNALRLADLTPSSVQPVDDSVLQIPRPRSGTAQVALTGTYTGDEEATYDIEIIDDGISTNLISAPIFTGAGSGKLLNVVATGTAQNYAVELADAGLPARSAFVDFEGVKIVSRASGAVGNAIRLLIDQTGLIFTPSSYSLLDDLPAGSGSDSNGLEGAAFDWDTAVIGSDNQIPASAHRIAFGDDTSVVYLAYKRFQDTKWTFHFVPEIKRTIVKGTIVNFVTGGREVTVTDAITPEIYTNIVTVFDLLEALKLGSILVDIAGVVANDRSPTGQAARELSLRTDAHAEPSYGSGSKAATGFEDVFVGAGAGTELVTATCFAVTARDNPGAHLGAELWKVKGSLAGDAGEATTGVPFSTAGSPSDWGFTIPRRLPDGYGAPHGRFSVTSIDYVFRQPPIEPPPICVVSMELGPDAVDQSVTLVYTKRPSGACLCGDMPKPFLRTACLGIFGEGGADMAYSADAISRLKDLYDWATTLVSAVSSYIPGKDYSGIPTTEMTLGDDALAGSTAAENIKGTSTITSSSTGTGWKFPMEVGPVTTGFADEAIPVNFQEVLDFYETGIAEIDAVADVVLKADGFTQWDIALAVFQADLDTTPLGVLGDRLATITGQKYKILVRQAMAYAGIPQLGKTDADDIISGDGCWRDWGDPFYWEVVGSDKGKYAPAFNNHPYYASRLATDGKRYYSTHEFAFQINVKCPAGLLVGDRINMSIGDAGYAPTYQIGDVLTLPIIAAQPFYLAGGQDANDLQKWFVSASVDGPLAPFTYSLSASSPHSYSVTGLSFDIDVGGIPFEKGDRWVFGVEGAHYRWRKNGGSYSASIAVPLAPTSFDSGLSIEFTTGAAPSFVADDLFSFRVLQPWAVSNIQFPSPARWQWDEDDPTLVADLGEELVLEMTAFALHTLPLTATAIVEGGTAPGVYLWSETLTIQAGVVAKEFATPHTARYVRLSLTGAIDAGIGWWWIGEPLATELSAAVQLRKSYKVARGGSGLYQGGRFLGKALSGDIEFSEGALTETDKVKIESLIDWLKENDDEPFIFVPQITRPTEALIAQIITDDVDIIDISDYNRDAAFDRRFSAKLPLSGVWQ